MNPVFNKIHTKFRLNHAKYSRESLTELAYSLLKNGLPFEKETGDFLIDWLNDKEYIIVNTSGSTGKPKSIALKKQAMVNSAIATGNYFNLKPGDKALHCLPTSFIAGKMMIVRALILGLELDCIEPKSKPNINVKENYQFCAMLPMQLTNVLTSCDNINTIIVGGAAVSEDLKNKIATLSSSVYETYGMTETITHIAVKKLNKFNKVSSSVVERSSFKTLPNIAISQDARDCLVIKASKLTPNKIVTNDVVKLHSETEFEWLGRIDNVINSGGLKLYPEEIEKRLASQIKQRFFIASEPDSVLGERLILVVEGITSIKIKDLDNLSKFQKPKALYTILQFVETPSGKLQRKKTLALLK